MDIYALTEENPWRIELWGDEIDSIRSFDAQSQRSLENLEEIVIYPAAEQQAENSGITFPDYFPADKTLIFLDEPNRLVENARLWRKNSARAAGTERKKGRQTFPGAGCADGTIFRKN